MASAFGVQAKYDLFHVRNRDRRLAEVLVHVAPGVRVLPAARAVKKLGKLHRSQQEALIEAIAGMEHPADVILVDTTMDHPLGFSPLGLAAQDTIVVASATGAAITEAYALIKKVSLGYDRRHFRILVEQGQGRRRCRGDLPQPRRVGEDARVALLESVGYVPQDDMVRHALRLSQPAVSVYPESVAAGALRGIAGEILGWPAIESEAGGSNSSFSNCYT